MWTVNGKTKNGENKLMYGGIYIKVKDVPISII